MKKVNVKSYTRKGKKVKGYSRKKRPIGKKRIQSKQKFVMVQDEYGHGLGYQSIKKKKK